MSNYIGEYEVTIDAKGRFMIPTGFKRQLNTEVVTTYVISRGFESCLTLYTNEQWKKIEQIVNGLNDFNPKSRILKRKFLNGATPIEADAAGRLLLSKQLLEHAGITKDAVFSAKPSRFTISSFSLFFVFVAQALGCTSNGIIKKLSYFKLLYFTS